MKRQYLSIFSAIILSSAVASAADDARFQVNYASNLAIGDSVVNITNVGAGPVEVIENGGAPINAAPVANGNMCVNVYTFSPDEQMISCCSCPVTPNALVSLSARNDLISNTLTPAVPTSIVIKLLGSAGSVCNAATAGNNANPLVTGLVAWESTIHALPTTPGSPATTYGRTETPFTPATLSPAELRRLTNLCLGIQIDGSGFGICRSCRLGGLGAVQQ